MDTTRLPTTTNSLLLPHQSSSPTYDVRRPIKKNDYIPVPLRWYKVLALHLSGKKAIEIKEETGYSIPMIHRILNHKSIQSVRQQLMDSTQQEFEALFDRIVNNIRTQLDSTDEAVKLAAQQQWFKANGKFGNGGKTKIVTNITAEQVVQNILEGKDGNEE